MTQENIVYTVCGLLLGLIIGSFLIGPHLAKTSLAGAPAPAEAAAAPPAAAAAGPMQGDPNMMNRVREQLETLKQTIAKDPNNFDALAQLGGMYMDAAKYPQAVEYFERALKVRSDDGVRYDLIVCYRQSGQMDRARAEFATLQKARPGDADVARLGQALAQ
jgi:cytochrome c-type biogenesis protein CcmH/NrfG